MYFLGWLFHTAVQEVLRKDGEIQVLVGQYQFSQTEGSLLRTPCLVELPRKINQKVIQQINFNGKK
jgi:hypothetical protein